MCVNAVYSYYLCIVLPWIMPWSMNKNSSIYLFTLTPMSEPLVDWITFLVNLIDLHPTVNLYLHYLSPTSHEKKQKTNPSASTGLLVEVLRKQGEHCLNYSKTQLPSAPRSKAEDYQQPAVMRPRWLEITGTAWYTLPPTTALLQETVVEHPEKDNSNLVMWVSLDVNSSSSARCTLCDTAGGQKSAFFFGI